LESIIYVKAIQCSREFVTCSNVWEHCTSFSIFFLPFLLSVLKFNFHLWRLFNTLWIDTCGKTAFCHHSRLKIFGVHDWKIVSYPLKCCNICSSYWGNQNSMVCVAARLDKPELQPPKFQEIFLFSKTPVRPWGLVDTGALTRGWSSQSVELATRLSNGEVMKEQNSTILPTCLNNADKDSCAF
jgi:hypothetical protein